MEDLIYLSNKLRRGVITIDEFRLELSIAVNRMSEDDLWGICLCHEDVASEDARLAALGNLDDLQRGFDRKN
jgi:hypothetical protein